MTNGKQAQDVDATRDIVTGDLGHGGGVELVRDGGHEHDEGGAQAEASQGEAGRGRHEQVRPGQCLLSFRWTR